MASRQGRSPMRQELGMAAGAIGALVVVAAGYVFYQANWGTPLAPLTTPAPLSQPVVLPATEPQPEQTAGDQVEPGQVSETPDATTEPGPDRAGTVVPAFDVVRIEPGGAALVAGTAEPGAEVSLLIEGEVLATARADSSGNFVAMFTLPPAETPRVMTLTGLSEGTEVAVSSEQSVIVAPPPPLVVAEAQTVEPAGPDTALAPVAEPEDAPAPPADPEATAQRGSDDAGVADVSGEGDPAKTTGTPQEDGMVAGGDAASRSLGVLGGGADGSAPVADAAAVETGTPADEAATRVAGEVPALIDTPGAVTGDPAVPEAGATADAPAPVIAADGGVTQPGTGEDDAPAEIAADTATQPITPGEPVAAASPESAPAADETPGTDAVADASQPGDQPQPAEDGSAPALAADASADAPQPEEEPQIAADDTAPQSGGGGEPVSAEAPPSGETGAPTPATQPEAAPVVLLADSEGIKVLQDGGAGPRALQAVTIDTISYDVEGEVELAGRGRGAAAVRIYLDNAPVKTTRIAEDGRWRTPLPEVESGIYTLRVDELAEDGTVTSRSETPFLREEPAVVAAAAAAEGGGSGTAGPDNDAGAAPPALRVITVQPGYTLWGIARAEYGAGELFVRVYDANRDQIRDPHWIYPGQVFTIPGQ